jgi:putative acetyltransferase
MLNIIQPQTDADIDLARALFREYEVWLGLSLCFQGFAEELRTLPGKYVPPEGRLLLAYHDTKLAGCIAMRKLEDDICEMKRLFVKEQFRGQRIGQQLIERIIDEARSAGYKTMRLDTYPPKMSKAVGLYESYGFREISPYYDNPHGDTLFMELQLY